MDFEAIKLGFKNYLESLAEISNKEYATTESSISIFMYADEFKNYLSDELNCDTSIFSKSISEILEMEIVNGQLVDPDEAAKTGKNPQSQANTIQCENTDGLANPEAISSETTQTAANEAGTQLDNNEFLTNILNELLTDSTFIDTLDCNEDGNINTEELTEFLNAIKNYDLDDSNISIEDILSAVQDIQDGVFEFAADDVIDEIIGETPIADEAGISPTAQQAGSNASFDIPSTYNEAQKRFNGVKEKTLDNMDDVELAKELTSANEVLIEKQTALDNAYLELDKLRDAETTALDECKKELATKDAVLAEQLEQLNKQLSNKQKEVDDNDKAIANQERVVGNDKTAYDNAVSRRKNLEDILSTLDSTDRTEMDSEKQFELDNKITAIKKEIEIAKENEQKAKEKYEASQKELENLKETKNKLESNEDGQLGDLQQKLAELQNKVVTEYPEMQEYFDNYENAKSAHQNYKTDKIAKAEKEVNDAQNYVNKVQTAITNYNKKTDNKNFGLSNDLSDELLQFAYSMLGFSEGQVEKNCGYNLPDGLWCAAFVKYCLKETYGDDLPSWYTNCNFNSCSEVLAAANKNGSAFRNANDAKPGDLIIFNTNRGTARHIGIVVSVDPDGTVHTIEGNTSSHVGERTYKAGTSRINSFVRITEG